MPNRVISLLFILSLLLCSSASADCSRRGEVKDWVRDTDLIFRGVVAETGSASFPGERYINAYVSFRVSKWYKGTPFEPTKILQYAGFEDSVTWKMGEEYIVFVNKDKRHGVFLIGDCALRFPFSELKTNPYKEFATNIAELETHYAELQALKDLVQPSAGNPWPYLEEAALYDEYADYQNEVEAYKHALAVIDENKKWMTATNAEEYKKILADYARAQSKVKPE